MVDALINVYFIRDEFVSKKKHYIFFVRERERYLQILVAVPFTQPTKLLKYYCLAQCMENMRDVHKNHRTAGKRTLRYQTFSFLSCAFLLLYFMVACDVSIVE